MSLRQHPDRSRQQVTIAVGQHLVKISVPAVKMPVQYVAGNRLPRPIGRNLERGIDAQFVVWLAMPEDASFIREREHQSLANQGGRCRMLPVGVQITQFDEADAGINRARLRNQWADL